jgi:hypothetical protein
MGVERARLIVAVVSSLAVIAGCGGQAAKQGSEASKPLGQASSTAGPNSCDCNNHGPHKHQLIAVTIERKDPGVPEPVPQDTTVCTHISGNGVPPDEIQWTNITADSVLIRFDDPWPLDADSADIIVHAKSSTLPMKFSQKSTQHRWHYHAYFLEPMRIGKQAGAVDVQD